MRELAHRHVLDDPVLDLGKAVVVLIEHPRGFHDVPVVLGRLLPRHRDEPVDVGPDDALLGRGLRDLLEPPDLLERLLLHLVRHAGGLDLLAKLVDLRGAVIVAELLLDRLHLLAQDVLALRLVEGLLHVILDLRLHLQDLVLLREEDREEPQPLDDALHLEELLPLFDGEVLALRDEVGEVRGVVGALRGHRDLGHDRAAVLDVVAEQALHAPEERLALDRLARDLGHGLERDAEVAVVRREAGDLHPLEALHDHLRAAVRDPEQPHDLGDRGDAVDLVGRDVVDLRVLLRGEDDVVLLIAHRRVDRGHALLATDPEGLDDLWEHHHLPQRDEWQLRGVGANFLSHWVASFPLSGARRGRRSRSWALRSPLLFERVMR